MDWPLAAASGCPHNGIWRSWLRVSVGLDIETLIEQDMIDNYATFFAVCAPGRVLAERGCELVSLPDLFVRYAKYRQGGVGKGAGSKTVWVPTARDQDVRGKRPMPELPCFDMGRPR